MNIIYYIHSTITTYSTCRDQRDATVIMLQYTHTLDAISKL